MMKIVCVVMVAALLANGSPSPLRLPSSAGFWILEIHDHDLLLTMYLLTSTLLHATCIRSLFSTKEPLSIKALVGSAASLSFFHREWNILK